MANSPDTLPTLPASTLTARLGSCRYAAVHVPGTWLHLVRAVAAVEASKRAEASREPTRP